MSATKLLRDVPEHKAGWKLVVNGEHMPSETNWEVISRFGSVRPVVVMHDDGTPNFDRPEYAEATNVNIVAWGRDENNIPHVGIIRQPRPHADDPEQPEAEEHQPVLFGQVPMGFIEKLFGEDPEKAAAREVREETAANVVLRMERPQYPWHNPNPTFVRTWSDLVFVEVDLGKIGTLRATRDEPIFSAEFVPVRELLRRIREGKDEEGAVYRMCTANSILMVFFATHPEIFSA